MHHAHFFNTCEVYYKVYLFLLLVLASSIGASSGARVSDAVIACSASKDFCKDSLTLNDEIGQRRFQRYSRVLGPQPRIIEQSFSLNGVGKFVKKENFHPQWESNPCTLASKSNALHLELSYTYYLELN